MKFLSVFVILAVAVCYIRAQELTKESAIAIAMECKAEKGASDADMEALKAHESPSTPEGKCTVACVMEKFGVLVDGKLVKDRAIEVGKAMFVDNPEKATAAVEACASLEVDDDPCEAAVQYAACMKKNAAA